MFGHTVSEQVSCVQDLGAVIWVCDVQVVQVRLLQSGEVLQALEAMHGQQGTQLLKRKQSETLIRL